MVSWNPNYGNGAIPTSVLVDYDGLGHYLHPNAASSLRNFSNAFAAAFGSGITISEGYRTYATQVYYWNLYQSGNGNVAARPGTSSHGEAIAADFNSWIYGSGGSTKHNWLVANAPRFGWSWELVGKPSGESWHFNYVGALAGSVGAGGNSTPIAVGDDEEMLTPEAQDWVTRTVRDQVGAIVRDQVLPAIASFRSEAVGRQDQNIRPALADIQNWVKGQFPATILAAQNAGRRDARNVRLYSQDFGTEIRAVDWHTGTVETFANADELAFAVKIQSVSANGTAAGITAEPPVKLNKADWDRLMKVANQRKARTQETATEQATRLGIK